MYELWIGSCETRQLNRIWIRIAAEMYLCKSNNFYLPCKFTVQVVLFPRSNTTTLVAAAIVSVSFFILFLLLLCLCSCLLFFFSFRVILFQCLVSRYCTFTCAKNKKKLSLLLEFRFSLKNPKNSSFVEKKLTNSRLKLMNNLNPINRKNYRILLVLFLNPNKC